jgi:hypothetical protein
VKKPNKFMFCQFCQFVFAITSFDLWMSKGVHDIFVVVTNFLAEDCVPKRITIGLFETFETLD